MRVLGVDVPADLASRWLGWFMPPLQPFLVPTEVATQMSQADGRDRLCMEHKDTFLLYAVPEGQSLVWLDEEQASALPGPVRRAQPGSHVWPSEPADRHLPLVVGYVEEGRRPSRHAEVEDEIWESSRSVVSHAERLGGRFPSGSGPNCFGAVMAAAGVEGAEEVWMQREPFEAWLTERSRPAGSTRGDGDAGTVLVWRDGQGAVQHAAVTLGGGWALHKPSQGWMSPTKVLTVAEVKASARSRGRRLHRYTLATA